MKNITVAFDDETARRARVAAAKAGTSMSRYLARATLEKLERDEATETQRDRNRQLEAIERFLSGPKLPISENGRMPTAEQRNARR